MTSYLFQRRLTDIDVVFFCFPCNQPKVGPMNCGLVTLQMMKLISPLESYALVSKYPQGMLLNTLVQSVEGDLQQGQTGAS